MTMVWIDGRVTDAVGGQVPAGEAASSRVATTSSRPDPSGPRPPVTVMRSRPGSVPPAATASRTSLAAPRIPSSDSGTVSPSSSADRRSRAR